LAYKVNWDKSVRKDAYYRLNEFVITLPPLRERDDILDLETGFLVEANMEFGRACREISGRAAEVLLRYPWPGNVRELRNVIRRAMLLASDVIEPDDLAFLSAGASPTIALRGELGPGHSSLKEIAGAAAKEAEQQAIQRALEITMGNKSEAARLLRTDYQTLHLKIKHYGVDARRFRESHARGDSPI
jgi:two-component system nitrogen regulation response regulator GlnG